MSNVDFGNVTVVIYCLGSLVCAVWITTFFYQCVDRITRFHKFTFTPEAIGRCAAGKLFGAVLTGLFQTNSSSGLSSLKNINANNISITINSIRESFLSSVQKCAKKIHGIAWRLVKRHVERSQNEGCELLQTV